MIRGFLVIVSVFVLLSSCTQKVICPAYQSSFIYDKEAMRKKFSYFNEDSTPKILTASKSKYLIAVPESYRKKYRKMQTIEMTPVYPVIPDSLKPKDDDLSLAEAESDVTDSTSVGSTEPKDSVYAITKTKEKYNLDQDLYMWYFRDMLVLPDVRAAMEKKAEAEESKNDVGKTSDGKTKKEGGFFKNLFRKNPKSDSLSQKSNVKDVNGPPAKKKGLFGKKKEEPPVKKEEPPKDKKKDDGF